MEEDALKEYSIEELMDDQSTVTVIVGKGEKTFWLRPPTETEKAMASNAARQKSRQLRDKLQDTKSEEHELLITAEVENLSIEEMRMIWLTANLFQKRFELNRRFMDNREEYFADEPAGSEDGVIPPTNAELEEHEQEKQRQEKQRQEDLLEQQTVVFNDLKKQSEELSEDDLKNIIEPLIIDQRTSQEWNAQYGLQVLIRCTFNDSEYSDRSFKTTEEALKLLNSNKGKKAMDALMNAHNGLLLDPDLIKN